MGEAEGGGGEAVERGISRGRGGSWCGLGCSTLACLFLPVVEVLADGCQQLTPTLEVVLVIRPQQLEQTVMHDCLRQHPQLEQFTDEPAKHTFTS